MLKVIKTGDLDFDRKVETAMAKVREFTENKSLQEGIALAQVFHAVITYWVAKYLGLGDQEKRYIEKINRLYALFPKMKIDREEVEGMSMEIMELMVKGDNIIQPKRKGSRRR